MTISPQSPNLSVLNSEDNLRVLVEDHVAFISLWLEYSLEVYIKKGYVTDGASIPCDVLAYIKAANKIKSYISKHYRGLENHWDFIEFVNFLLGTPWDYPRILAAIVHDVLYGRKWAFRWICDIIYRLILSENNYDRRQIFIEYYGIRLLGWRNWRAITEAEVTNTKQYSEVKIIRTSRVAQEVERIRGKKIKIPPCIRTQHFDII